MLAWFSLRPAAAEVGLFTAGWLAGWVVFWRGRPLSGPDGSRPRPAAAVIVPARNEEHAVATVVGRLQPKAGDVVLVVDDHSTDATAARAATAGARVMVAPPLPEGWLGKPNACWAAVGATTESVLVFLDADVTPPADLLDRLVPVVVANPDALVSVQPWHVPGRAVEHLSLPFNVVALMGSGGFTAGGPVRRPLAFGPVLACTRSAYLAAGGHAHPTVRRAVAEDLALGRRFDRVVLHTGRPDVTFRMYPGGWRAVVDGWTKHVAVGAARTRWWIAALAVTWVWSQLGGWLVSPWFWAAATIQLWVLARRAGRFSPVAVLAGPLLTLVFVGVFLRSAVLAGRGRSIAWKGRSVQPR